MLSLEQFPRQAGEQTPVHSQCGKCRELVEFLMKIVHARLAGVLLTPNAVSLKPAAAQFGCLYLVFIHGLVALCHSIKRW